MTTVVAPALCLRSYMEAMREECRTEHAGADVIATLNHIRLEYPDTFRQIECGLGHMAAHWLQHHSLTEGDTP